MAQFTWQKTNLQVLFQTFYELTFAVGHRVAVKAMQKGKITDYESFRNEI